MIPEMVNSGMLFQNGVIKRIPHGVYLTPVKIPLTVTATANTTSPEGGTTWLPAIKRVQQSTNAALIHKHIAG